MPKNDITINEKAFQYAFEATKSAEVHQNVDDVLRHSSIEEKTTLAEKTVMRAFLKAYLSFKG